jgi:thiol-disulfide isomerase/thioredoxin
MRHWTGTLLVAVLVAVPLLALYKPTEEKHAEENSKDRAKQFQSIQADYQKAVPEVQKAFNEAKSSKEREAVLEKLNNDFGPRILKLVEDDPKDKLSLEMLVFAIRALPNVDSKAFDLLTENWAKDDSVNTKYLCQFLLAQPQARAKKLLQTVLEENKNKDIQGYACFALARMAAEQANEGNKKAAEAAEKYYERISKDFADVKLGEKSTLGEQAKGPLFEIRHLSVGKSPPNVESRSLDGEKVQLKDYKGKVVVLDIWATWCGPCKSMIPHEREMATKHKDDPFALISVSGDEEKSTLKKFLETTKMPWTHWWDGPKGEIIKGWNIQAFPTIYVLDAEGVIRHKFIGVPSTKELDGAVDKLLAEAKEKK